MIQEAISLVLSFLIVLFPAISPNQQTNSPTKHTSILFTGDIMLGRSVMGEAIDRKDYLYPFRNVQNFLSDSDITFVNLENAIIENCPRQYKGSFTFCTTPDIAKGLVESGVDIVTLANNHSGNFGQKGLEETKRILDGYGIKWVDGTNLEIIEKNGIKFGFLGFDFVYRGFSEEDKKLIEDSNRVVDVLIVSPHWGDEYKNVANKFQTETAKVMVELGADLIVGHHPHWVQNYVDLSVATGTNSVPVYYSLGNFIFDQMWSEETKKGMAVKVVFEEQRIIDRQEYKVYIEKLGQPVLK